MAVPRPLRLVIGAVGAAVLAFAAVMFVRPAVVVDAWPWPLTTATARSISAFLAFPAVTWLWFLFDERWSSFRITQQTAGLGMFLIGVGALRARDEFAGDGELAFYVGALAVALAFVVALQVVMDRRAGGLGRGQRLTMPMSR